MDDLNISPDTFIVVGIAVAGLLAAYFFLIPLLLLATLKMEARPKVVPFDSETKKPPRDIVKYYEDVDRQLKQAGFEQITGVLMPAPLPNVRVILWLYVHQSNRDEAMVTALWGMADGADPLKTRYVEIISEYRDGPLAQVVTNNNEEVGAFPDPPNHLISRFPQLKKIDLLYRYHQMIVRRDGLQSGKVLPLQEHYDGDVSRYLQEKVLGEEYNRQVENGYLRLSPSGRYFKPTFLGVYPMTWKNLFPIKQMIQAGYKRKAKQLEEELRAGA